MDIIDFFNSDTLELPKTRPDVSFEVFLRSCFDQYLQAVAGLKSTDSVTLGLKRHVSGLEQLCQGICDAVSVYFEGFPGQAYVYLEEALKHIDQWLMHLISRDVSGFLQHLYRIRCGILEPFGREDLFHIPFEKRHLVKTQRYSIPGLPSLYLGGSVWLCWEECGRPDLDSMHMARFKAVGEVRVLDFGWRPAQIAAMIDANQVLIAAGGEHAQFALRQAMCWPLLAACSIKALRPGQPFVPEYVVPQLLLQWVRKSSEVEGLRYFSTKIWQYCDDPQAVANYVFPVKQKADNGHCPVLQSSFEVSEPISWSMLKHADIAKSNSRKPPSWEIQLTESVRVPYQRTEFWECEAKLDDFPCAKL
jgi:hypothetical protein